MAREKKDEPEALFIPAGVLTGMGFGFLYGNLVAGLFLGLGAGFVIFALIAVTTRNRPRSRHNTNVVTKPDVQATEKTAAKPKTQAKTKKKTKSSPKRKPRKK